MTPEAQRIAIAEACGWKCAKSRKFWKNSAVLGPVNSRKNPPDYLSDLNAMAEAEKSLGNAHWWKYIKQLETVCGALPIVFATAAQRAEAFLRTLNLWNDNL